MIEIIRANSLIFGYSENHIQIHRVDRCNDNSKLHSTYFIGHYDIITVFLNYSLETVGIWDLYAWIACVPDTKDIVMTPSVRELSRYQNVVCNLIDGY